MSQLPDKLFHPRHWLSWLGVGSLIPLAFAPWQFRHWLGKQIGQYIYRHNAKRRRIIAANLQACFPDMPETEREQLTLQNLQTYAAALLDYSLLFFRSRRWLLDQTDIVGLKQLEDSLNQQHNIMLLLGHTVWLEFAPLAIGQRYPAYGSYKPFKNPVIDWLISRSRLKDVQFVIAREEGMIKLVRSLEPGRLLFFLPDQDHGEKASVFAPFFATSKATLTTPARIAKLGKADAFPVMAFFNSGRYRVVIGNKLESFGQETAEKDASSMNAGFVQLIGQAPEQYMWLLKLLKTRPNGAKQLY